MSHFKKKYINILYKSKADMSLNQKKTINYKINTNGINNGYKKNLGVFHNNLKKNKLKGNYLESENDYSLANDSFLPTFKKNEYYEDLILSKDKYNNNTIFNSKMKKCKFYIKNDIPKLSINTNFNKNKIKNIPTSSNSNINTLYNNLNIKKDYFYLKNNNKQKIINTYKIKKIEFIKKKPLFTEFNIKNSLKINKKNNYSTINVNVKKLGNINSINRIKEKIKKMENEFSSNEVKKILINRPMRTLNSKSFQFNSKEFKNLSPTFRVLNHLKTKKKNVQQKLTNFLSEKYRNNIIKVFKRNYYSSNNLFENSNFSLSKSGTNKIFKSKLSELNNNRSSDKSNIFNNKIKLQTNKENSIYNEIMKCRNYYKIPVITSEYKRCSKYIRNENRTNFLKSSLFNSSNINQDFNNKSSQLEINLF